MNHEDMVLLCRTLLQITDRVCWVWCSSRSRWSEYKTEFK